MKENHSFLLGAIITGGGLLILGLIERIKQNERRTDILYSETQKIFEDQNQEQSSIIPTTDKTEFQEHDITCDICGTKFKEWMPANTNSIKCVECSGIIVLSEQD